VAPAGRPGAAWHQGGCGRWAKAGICGRWPAFAPRLRRLPWRPSRVGRTQSKQGSIPWATGDRHFAQAAEPISVSEVVLRHSNGVTWRNDFLCISSTGSPTLTRRSQMPGRSMAARPCGFMVPATGDRGPPWDDCQNRAWSGTVWDDRTALPASPGCAGKGPRPLRLRWP